MRETLDERTWLAASALARAATLATEDALEDVAGTVGVLDVPERHGDVLTDYQRGAADALAAVFGSLRERVLATAVEALVAKGRHAEVLRVLGERPGSCQRDIAALANIQPGALGGVLAALSAAKLVEPAPLDPATLLKPPGRRVRAWRLTSWASDLQPRLFPGHAKAQPAPIERDAAAGHAAAARVEAALQAVTDSLGRLTVRVDELTAAVDGASERLDAIEAHERDHKVSAGSKVYSAIERRDNSQRPASKGYVKASYTRPQFAPSAVPHITGVKLRERSGPFKVEGQHG